MYTHLELQQRKDGFEVIVYYSFKGKKFRPGTKVFINDPVHFLGEKGISSRVTNYKTHNLTIEKFQTRIENVISSYVTKYSEKPTVEFLKKELERPFQQNKKELDDLFMYWEEFKKDKQLINKTEASFNRFSSLKSTIEKFREEKNYNLSFRFIDVPFFDSFIKFLIKEYTWLKGKEKIIGLDGETARKRIDDFVGYLEFCSITKDVHSLNLPLIKFKVKELKKKYEVKGGRKKKRVSLTQDELEFICNLKFHESDFYSTLSPLDIKVLEVFIFLCLQGTSPKDGMNITKKDIIKGVINKDRFKTSKEFNVELHSISKTILEKYNYDLTVSHPVFNRYLKSIFTHIFNLYKPYYEKKHNEKYSLTFEKKEKGASEIKTKVHKGQCVEGTTARRTFITIMVNRAKQINDLSGLIGKVGHSTIKMTLHYHQDHEKKGDLIPIIIKN